MNMAINGRERDYSGQLNSVNVTCNIKNIECLAIELTPDSYTMFTCVLSRYMFSSTLGSKEFKL